MKTAEIRNRCNQVIRLTQVTILQSDKNTRKHHIPESQELSPTSLQGTDKNSKYDQEILQSQTADNPVDTARKSHITIMRHQEGKQNKATSSPLAINMIAKLVLDTK